LSKDPDFSFELRHEPPGTPPLKEGRHRPEQGAKEPVA